MIHSEELFSILSAVIAVISYTLYAKSYEKILRKTHYPLVSSTILYGLSSMILFLSVLVAYCIGGWELDITTNTSLWGYGFSNPDYYWVILVTILVMSIGYYIHIATEAVARKTVNMGVYAIFFQSNIVVIVLLDWLANSPVVSNNSLTGSFLVLIASVLAIVYSANKQNPLRINPTVIIIASLSAISCGTSLFIDGEISKNLIINNGLKITVIAPFLSYEFLTFFIPTVLSITYLILKNNFIYIYSLIIDNFKTNKLSYFLSSLFSVFQFVFSVFALSYTNSRLIIAVVFGLSPILNVLVDKNPKTINKLLIEIGISILSLAGIILVLINL